MSGNGLEGAGGKRVWPAPFPALKGKKGGTMVQAPMTKGCNVLLEKLTGKQEQLGLSDSEFARRLKVSRQQWQATRTGHQPIGEKMINGILGMIFARDFDVDIIRDILRHMETDARG